MGAVAWQVAQISEITHSGKWSDEDDICFFLLLYNYTMLEVMIIAHKTKYILFYKDTNGSVLSVI